VLVDTQGLMLHAIVHAADIQDRDGGGLLIATLFGLHPFLTKLYADGGYQGPRFADAVAKAIGQLEVEIVKRSELHRFVVLPKRWLVERTIAWLNRCRSLAKDWENRSQNALAFLRLASVHLAPKAMQPGITFRTDFKDADMRGAGDQAQRQDLHRRMRHAAQARLRQAVFHWARIAVQHDPKSRCRYEALRARGHSYGRALSGVADRLLGVACVLLKHQTLFDPAHGRTVEP